MLPVFPDMVAEAAADLTDYDAFVDVWQWFPGALMEETGNMCPLALGRSKPLHWLTRPPVSLAAAPSACITTQL